MRWGFFRDSCNREICWRSNSVGCYTYSESISSSGLGSKKYYHDSCDDGYYDTYRDGDYGDDRYDSDDDYAVGVENVGK